MFYQRYLNVSNNSISTLQNSLKLNRQLQKIDISNNQLGTKINYPMAKAFYYNFRLQSVNLR